MHPESVAGPSRVANPLEDDQEMEYGESSTEEEGFDVTASRSAIDIDLATADKAKVFFWPWVIAGFSLIGFVVWTAMNAPQKKSNPDGQDLFSILSP